SLRRPACARRAGTALLYAQRRVADDDDLAAIGNLASAGERYKLDGGVLPRMVARRVKTAALVAPLRGLRLADRRPYRGRVPDEIVGFVRIAPERLVVHLQQDAHADRIERPGRGRDRFVTAHGHVALYRGKRCRWLFEIDKALVPRLAHRERKLVANERRIEDGPFLFIDRSLQHNTRSRPL